MSKLILITGDLATGKSTLAKNLSKKLLINCFTKDDIKEKFCDMYGFRNREENRQMSVKATDFMIHTFGVFCLLPAAGAVSAGPLQTFLNSVRDFLVGVN